jgi:hypothetical protein
MTSPKQLGRRYNLGVRTFFAVIWVLFMIGTPGTIFIILSCCRLRITRFIRGRPCC